MNWQFKLWWLLKIKIMTNQDQNDGEDDNSDDDDDDDGNDDGDDANLVTGGLVLSNAITQLCLPP